MFPLYPRQKMIWVKVATSPSERLNIAGIGMGGHGGDQARQARPSTARFAPALTGIKAVIHAIAQSVCIVENADDHASHY
jgi:hypothetical protein